MPPPLERQTPPPPKPWALRNLSGVAAMIFGLAALLAGFWTQFRRGHEITEPSELRVVLPLGAVALVAAVVALVRREPTPALAVGGLAMALAAPLLGWVVLVAAVAAAAMLALLVIAKFH